MILAFWSVLVGALSYGVLSTGVALCYAQGAGLGDVVAAQVLVGWICLFLLGGRSFYKAWRLGMFSRKDLVYGLVLGASTTLIGFFYYQCVSLLGVSWSVLLLFQYPWFSMALDCIRHRRLPTKSEIILLSVVALGTVLASGAQWRSLQGSGLLWGLVAAACYGLFLFGNTRIRSSASPLSKAFWVQSGALLALLLGFALDPWVDLELGLRLDFWQNASLNVHLLALMLGVFGCVLPPWLMAKGMPVVGVFWGSLISAVELPLAMALGALVLQEHLSPWMILGGLLVAFAPLFPWLLNSLRGSRT